MKVQDVGFGTSGVRGRVEDLTDAVCMAYTRAFLQMVEVLDSLSAGRTVALGIDLRPSSPAIATACAAAVRKAGYAVEYCGILPTPALAFHARSRGLPAVMVTGSHIPFDRNGIKFYRASGEISKAEEAMIAQTLKLTADPPVNHCRLPPESPVARQRYVHRYLDFFPPRFLSGLTLGVYQHSSVARDLIGQVLERFGARVVNLGRTDSFVPIDTEAVSLADAEKACEWAAQHRVDAILSTDGDADRPLISDENGAWFRGDLVGILSAQYLCADTVVTTVNCNTALELCAKFSRVCRTRIGSPYVIEGMESCLAGDPYPGVVAGFEPNGGFLLGSPVELRGRWLEPLLTRDALLPMLCLLAMARDSGMPLSALRNILPARFTASDRLQDFPTAMSQALIGSLSESTEKIATLLHGVCGRPLATDGTDGLRITLDGDEVVHFRSSGNAPELRCYVEASSEARARHLVGAALQRFLSVAMSERSLPPNCAKIN